MVRPENQSMGQVVVKQCNDLSLRKVIHELSSSLVQALNSFVEPTVAMQIDGEMQCVDLDEWSGSWTGTRSIIRGTIHGMEEEHDLVLVLDLADAITFCGYLMLASTEVIDADRESLELDLDHHATFGELGNLICSTISNVLRDRIAPECRLRIRDFATVEPGTPTGPSLGHGERLAYDFDLRIGDYPPGRPRILIDHEVGQAWNDGIPLFVFYEGEATDEAAAEDGAPKSPPRPRIVRRTRLSAFVTSLDAASMVRGACRKLGLEVQRHARTDVPNPAGHTGDIVLIEVPVGEERRFDWAKRLRQYRHDIPVVLLIHEPSRPRVVQGLLTRANAILAWPSTEAQLRAKVEPLIQIVPENET